MIDRPPSRGRAPGPHPFVDPDGVWVEVLAEVADASPRPALFLDRDGVIIEDEGYIRDASGVVLIAGAAATIAAFNRAGAPVVIVTNQSGIGRGFFGWEDFAAVQRRMLERLAAEGARVDAVLACPHPSAPNEQPHAARKPNPGMLLTAARLLRIELARSWIVGDRASDVVAGGRAGLEGAVHVATGAGSTAAERSGALAAAEAGRYHVLAASSIAGVPGLLPERSALGRGLRRPPPASSPDRS